MVMGRKRSMSEDYLIGLIGQCDGDIEDLEDGLSEAYASIVMDDELRLSGKRGRAIFDDQSGVDTSEIDDPKLHAIAPTETDVAKKPREVTTDLGQNAEKADADPVDAVPERDPRMHPGDTGAAGRVRELPEIRWDPLVQDRAQIVRNVASLYVYSTLQYALLEAVSRIEEG